MEKTIFFFAIIVIDLYGEVVYTKKDKIQVVGRLIVTLILMGLAITFMFRVPNYSWAAIIFVALLIIWDFMYYKNFQYFKLNKKKSKCNMSRDDPEELIVLGNGFDLSCGLKSSYIDFFKYRFCKLEKENLDLKRKRFFSHINIAETLEEAKEEPTLWDLVFKRESKNYRDPSWSNIEKILEETLYYSFYGKTKRLKFSKSTKFLLRIYKKKEKNISAFLLSQLRLFEAEFSDYISKQKNIKYIHCAEEKLNNELIDKNPVFKVNVLSFNYSLGEFDGSIRKKSTINKWINIHGYVGIYSDFFQKVQKGNKVPIIFGIDSKDIKDGKEELIPFTKAYRRLAINTIENELPRNIDKIVFYGHSLAPADYSYFESLFDIYKLYSSNLWLEFYYGCYSYKDPLAKSKKIKEFIDRKNNELKLEMITKVYKLIHHYGKSLSESHGDNLFYLLDLEGRIVITPDKGAYRLSREKAKKIEEDAE